MCTPGQKGEKKTRHREGHREGERQTQRQRRRQTHRQRRTDRELSGVSSYEDSNTPGSRPALVTSCSLNDFLTNTATLGFRALTCELQVDANRQSINTIFEASIMPVSASGSVKGGNMCVLRAVTVRRGLHRCRGSWRNKAHVPRASVALAAPPPCTPLHRTGLTCHRTGFPGAQGTFGLKIRVPTQLDGVPASLPPGPRAEWHACETQPQLLQSHCLNRTLVSGLHAAGRARGAGPALWWAQGPGSLASDWAVSGTAGG